MNKFNLWKFCLALGIVWGAASLLAGWCAALGWGELYVRVMSSIYIGYEPTFLGGIIGGIWGFFDGAIFGLAIAFVYNALVSEKKKTKTRKKG
ncbi:MAG: bacteriophage holin [Chlamydiia bacterium]|nr:bacteriophage holin [Chlamydiia bacterium]MCP5492365.1 bacteriophage holin [Chlamydiales bacterium]